MNPEGRCSSSASQAVRTQKQRRLSGLGAALPGADFVHGPLACLQSLGCTFPWTASGILRGPLAWPLTAGGQRDGAVTTWVTLYMDNLQGLRFHMPGRQWQMLDDMVAAKLRADTAPGHAAQAGAVKTCAACSSSQTPRSRSWQASKTSRAAEKRKSVAQTGKHLSVSGRAASQD